MTPTTFAHRGSNLEATVVASQRRVVCLSKIPTASKRIGRETVIQIKGPVDYAGSFRDSGIAFFFDSKQSANRYRCEIRVDHFPEHQRQFLIRHGEAGAVAGLLLEATHPDVARFYFLDWRHLTQREPSVAWTDPRLIDLGDNRHVIKFERLIRLAEQGVAR